MSFAVYGRSSFFVSRKFPAVFGQLFLVDVEDEEGICESGHADREKDKGKRETDMRHLTEIRWHGRGGQGAKTAALLLADVAFQAGRHVQGFPEYGPERMGAPITAYDRISDDEIRVHSNIYDPDFVAVVDDTLLHTVDVTSGLKEDGAILINTVKPAQEIIPLLNGYQGEVYTLDAHKVCMETMGQYFPNTPMLAALVQISQVMETEEFLTEMEASLQHKFARKPEVLEGNLKALRVAMKEVKKCS